MPNDTDPNLLSGWPQLRYRAIALAIALIIGVLVAISAVGFFTLVGVAVKLWAQPLPSSFGEIVNSYSLSVAVALGCSALIAGLILRLLDGGRPHGPADLIDAAQNDRSPDLRAGALSSILALSNLAGGASVGIFGPLVHFGGCLAAAIHARAARMPIDVMLGCGAGAAIASVFSAPLGAAIFAHEAIIRRFGAFGAAPVLGACFVAFWLSEILLGRHRFFTVFVPPQLDALTLVSAMVVGLICGAVATIYIHAVTSVPRLVRATGLPLSLRPLVPASILFILSPVLPHFLGSGLSSVELALGGHLALELMLVLIIGKVFLTPLCLGFGYFGGVFAPALFFGSMLGGIADAVLGGGHTCFALVGAASAVAAVIGAPVASTIIVFEMTGSYEGAVLSMISTVVAVQISRSFAGRSLFDRQLAMRGITVLDDHRPL